jgi:flagellar basal-body rod protein FlgG
MRSLSIGSTGMYAQQMNVETISNNIANISTAGYKRQRPEFQDLLYQNIRRPGSTSSDIGTVLPSGLQLGAGVRLDAISRIHTPGAIDVTDNQLDLAINGEGFFQIQMPDGTLAYTRDGTFGISGEGIVVTKEGYQLDQGITIPENATKVTINPNGDVFVKIEGQIEEQNIGQLNVVRFINPSGLEAIGRNLLLETTASGAPQQGTANQDGFGSIQQGALELSNVNIVNEITKMISAQRAYEMNSKVIQTSDEMLGTISNLR